MQCCEQYIATLLKSNVHDLTRDLGKACSDKYIAIATVISDISTKMHVICVEND